MKPLVPTKKIILRNSKKTNETDVPSNEKLIVIEKHFGKQVEIENFNDLKFSKSDNNFDEIVSEAKVKEIIHQARTPLNLNNNYNYNQSNFQAEQQHNVDFRAVPKTNVNLEDLKNQYNENTTKNENKIKKVYRRDNNNNNNFNNNNNNRSNYNNNINNNFNDSNILNNNEQKRGLKDGFIRKYDQFYMKNDEVNFGNAVNCTEYNEGNRIFKPKIIPTNSIYYFKFSSNNNDEITSLISNKNVIKTTINVNVDDNNNNDENRNNVNQN